MDESSTECTIQHTTKARMRNRFFLLATYGLIGFYCLAVGILIIFHALAPCFPSTDTPFSRNTEAFSSFL
ncbi:Uncharacterized protein HZ326_6881 [Fusarium oxysporum f. sp. albedinis]|nr:Uncharacterized protein HZ326_6881 [Fusarium oxysporum f. sp. albedinis]